MQITLHAQIALSLFLFGAHSLAFAAPPKGQSALLNGMHDIESQSWLKNATPGCDKGWLTDLRYIGTSGTPGVDCHQGATQAGISIIQRLDVSGTQSYPRNTSDAPGYARAFAHYARSCSNIHVWIVGNEPNFTEHKSDPDCTSAAYAAAYVAVHRAVHALPGHANDLVLVASNSPYSPGCIESLRQIIKAIQGAGIQPDGFALHAYTRANTGSNLNASLVTSTQTQQDNTRKECPGNATWSDRWHSHFRIYIDYIKAIEAAGLAGKAVLVTESGNACEPTIQNNACYPNADIGYFQALYAEANRWNNMPGTRTKIRAITPYRWTKNLDGTSRDFAIGQRPKLLQDLTKAFARKYSWTSSGCGSSACKRDQDCPAGMRCDAATGDCTTPPGSGCTASQCPGRLCSPSRCADRGGQCIDKGSTSISFSPPNPQPGGKVTVSVTHPKGWAFISLPYCGPTQGEGAFDKVNKEGSVFRWVFQVQNLQQGLYRFDFTADKGSNLVGSANLVVAPPCQPQTELCDGKDNDCDGLTDEALERACYAGAPNTKGEGLCQEGKQICISGTWSPCQGQILPQPEICDRQDNDCNGQIDEGCQPARGEPTLPDTGAAQPPDRATPPTAPPDRGKVITLDAALPTNRRPPRVSGCGCSHTPDASGWMWALLLCAAGLVLRRSRKRA